MMSGGTNSNKFPFTATQFQELQHQALIYKYMVSNIPVPSDLLFSIKRSCSLDPSKMLFGRQQPTSHIGWSCFQMGLGRKIDPEPGRCRRTDGKKWRCSKEAYPDSKYCERHMHRGKNRSRKPVEIQIGTNSAATNSTVVSSITKNNSVVNQSNFLTPPSHSLSLLSNDQTHHHFQNQLHYNSAYTDSSSHLNHHFLSSSRSLGIGLSSQDSSTNLLLDSADYRNTYGFKEVDEHAFFSEPSGSMRSLSGSSMEDAWQFTPLTMNSSSSASNQRGMSGLQNEYPYLQLQSFNDHDASKQQKQQYQQHNYSYLHGNMTIEQREEPQQTVHRFFDDLPPKNRDSWLDLDDKSQNNTSVSTTRLSISIPSPSHDFPIFNSSTHNDG